MDKTKAKIQELVPEINTRHRAGDDYISEIKQWYHDNYKGALEERVIIATSNWWANQFKVFANSPFSPTLADVLLAIKKNNIPDSEEQGIKLESDLISLIRGHFGFKGWDLTKSYDDQSQETKDFIGQILGVI